MKTALYFSTLLALALADKPSPAYSGASSVAASPDTYASPQAAAAAAPAAEASEPVAPSTQGFYYYYYPVASSYDTNTVQQKPAPGYGGHSPYAPDRTEEVAGSGLSGPLLGVIGVLVVAAFGAAVFMSGNTGRRAFSDALSSVDLDNAAYYVYQGIRLWTDVQKQ